MRARPKQPIGIEVVQLVDGHHLRRGELHSDVELLEACLQIVPIHAEAAAILDGQVIGFAARSASTEVSKDEDAGHLSAVEGGDRAKWSLRRTAYALCASPLQRERRGSPSPEGNNAPLDSNRRRLSGP